MDGRRTVGMLLSFFFIRVDFKLYHVALPVLHYMEWEMEGRGIPYAYLPSFSR